MKIKTPRIRSSPVAFECRLVTSLGFGPNQAVIIGEIVEAFVEDRYVLDARTGIVDTPGLGLVGAMHAARWYARTSDRFTMDRPSWAGWQADQP